MTAAPDKVEFYRDDQDKWRWRYRAANGRILADSGQGYSRLDKAEEGWRHITLAFGETPWFRYVHAYPEREAQP